MTECECGHEWEYKGHAIFATCPSCLKKTKVNKDPSTVKPEQGSETATPAAEPMLKKENQDEPSLYPPDQ